MIEVGTQSEISATIGDYAQYLDERTVDHKVINMISLELSKTTVGSKVLAPRVVRMIDWVDSFWDKKRRARGDYPAVQKYCLAGMEGSYTDFHIDFGGTSVWYHVVNGAKRFYFVPPSTENLIKFANWNCSSDQDSVFFGDLVANCEYLDLRPGQTMIIPSV